MHLAQTHLFETTHPFFHLSADRAALLRVTVTGSGAAPAVWVQGSAGGVYLGKFCLSGPATLPASVNAATPSPATSFVGMLPASWVRKGLQLQISAGRSSKLMTTTELKVGAAPVLTFVTSDWMLFGDTEPTPLPSGFAQEFAAKLPLTKVQYSAFPLQIPVAQLPIPPRSDGYSPTGVVGSQPAMLATTTPHCSAADKSAGTCAGWSGFGVLTAVRSMTNKLQGANGTDRFSHWYGALSKNRHVGGGLGGGVTGSGDDYGLTFNHELGHAFDMPHWGDNLYDRVAAGATQIHPYTGGVMNLSTNQANGGGFGNSWAYDPLAGGGFINPICQSTGRERQEPMQRVGSCLVSGRIFDDFGDYSALYVNRYFVGASSAYAGTVSSPRDLYGNLNPVFSFPTKGGRPNLVLGAAGSTPKIMKWNATSATYVEQTPAAVSSDSRIFGQYYPLQWNVPVYTLWGSFSSATPAASTIQAPLKYNGNLKRLWDPTNPTDFAAMKSFISGDSFWWGADLVAKAEFSDGSVKHALITEYARGADPLAGNTFAYWAINIPAPSTATLTRVSLYYRPMEVRYGDGGNPSSVYYVSTNLNSTLNNGVTAANYLSGATLVATKDFTAP
ncbi:MAG: M66 family metalloprotease [Leptothrix sp. (in: b-proteobacteria)]